jgi:hypothetical protein
MHPPQRPARRYLIAAALCAAALGVWWYRALLPGALGGEGWVGWMSAQAWGATWLGLGLALAHARWRRWALPWLAVIAAWPWIERGWWADVAAWRVVAAWLGALAALWLMWRCALAPPLPSSAPHPNLRRALAAFRAARGADPDTREALVSRRVALITSRGLRLTLWGGGACVEAPHGGWPAANQRALSDAGAAQGVTVSFEAAAPRAWLLGEHAPPLAVKALDGWAARVRPAGEEGGPPPEARRPPLLAASGAAAAPDAALPVTVTRLVAAAAAGVSGLGVAWQVVIFPIWEGSWLPTLVTLGLVAVAGVAAAIQGVLRARGLVAARVSQGFAAAQALLRALLYDEEGDCGGGDLVGAADAGSAQAQGAGVVVTCARGGVLVTLSVWPLPGEAGATEEALTLEASGGEALSLSFLRGAMAAARLAHEGGGGAEGGGERVHLQAIRAEGAPSPWLLLARWWEARALDHLGDPDDARREAPYLSAALRAALRAPWLHAAPARAVAHLTAWDDGLAQATRRRRLGAVAVAVACVCGSWLAMPRLDATAYMGALPTQEPFADAIAAAADRCPAPPAAGTLNTWRRLDGLRCLAASTGQVGPLRRLDWEVLSRPLQRLLEAQAGWTLMQAISVGLHCAEGADRLRFVLRSPELRLSLALLSRYDGPTWQALPTARPFFWPNAVIQHARAVEWRLLERWVANCHSALLPDELRTLRALAQTLDVALDGMLSRR